ncbi:cupin [Lottiidibacillus patelloidae]|uniref:Cupin n=1 Tax=Lottiidibacillus patelloidae TaxID=2670334 RepID=A0A263BT91_9BACI|nr:cupin domain-containing protein [Lottiidibacillus patelloidae]OZM56924.1 cupin [Lottiidibacillus patelloidae]
MYHNYYYPNPYHSNQYTPMYPAQHMQSPYHTTQTPYSYWGTPPAHGSHYPHPMIPLKDYGPAPYVVNIEQATVQNKTFRTALWTGKKFQVTLMSINPGDDIGLEMHPNVDQFIRIEEGQGLVMMGARKDKLDFQKNVSDDFAIIIPAGHWHNLINTGHTPLKLYSIYAPPNHPRGTVHKTKAEAEAAEHY